MSFAVSAPWHARAAPAAAALLIAACGHGVRTEPTLDPGPAVSRPVDVEDIPFITTPDHVTVAMLELARVGPADHVIDLGSGDGRIVVTAARRFGASGLGVEIVPSLVARSRAAAERAGVAARVRFLEQDLFATDLSRATVVTMYLLPEVNLALRPRLLALAPGTRIVSHDWDLGDWLPDRTLTLPVPDKAVGREKLSRLHLWTVPARLGGTWCGPGVALHLDQRHQLVQAVLRSADDQHRLTGRVDGTRLRLLGPGPALLAGGLAGSELRLDEVQALPGVAGRGLRPSASGDCAGG